MRLYEFRIKRVRRSFAMESHERYTCPGTIARVFSNETRGEPREIFMVAALDTQASLIGFEKVAIGGASSVDVHPREVFRGAILAGANAIIVGHNHPSGSLDASGPDLDLTRRLHDAGSLLGIPLLDHLIVTDGAWASLREDHPRFWL